MSDRKELGQKIRQAREALGLLQDDIAKYLDIPRSAVSLMEIGKRQVSTLELKKIAQKTQQDLSFFLEKEIAQLEYFCDNPQCSFHVTCDPDRTSYEILVSKKDRLKSGRHQVKSQSGKLLNFCDRCIEVASLVSFTDIDS